MDGAELVQAISHDTMLELAAHGARVIAAEAVEFARITGIALFARGTESDGPGTRIGAGPDSSPLMVTAMKHVAVIVGKEGVAEDELFCSALRGRVAACALHDVRWPDRSVVADRRGSRLGRAKAVARSDFDYYRWMVVGYRRRRSSGPGSGSGASGHRSRTCCRSCGDQDGGGAQQRDSIVRNRAVGRRDEHVAP